MHDVQGGLKKGLEGGFPKLVVPQKAFMFTPVDTRTRFEREKRVISEIAAVSHSA